MIAAKARALDEFEIVQEYEELMKEFEEDTQRSRSTPLAVEKGARRVGQVRVRRTMLTYMGLAASASVVPNRVLLLSWSRDDSRRPLWG